MGRINTKELDSNKTYIIEFSEDTDPFVVGKLVKNIKQSAPNIHFVTSIKGLQEIKPLITPQNVIDKIAAKICLNEDEFINQCLGHEEELAWFIEILEQVRKEYDD